MTIRERLRAFRRWADHASKAELEKRRGELLLLVAQASGHEDVASVLMTMLRIIEEELQVLNDLERLNEPGKKR